MYADIQISDVDRVINDYQKVSKINALINPKMLPEAMDLIELRLEAYKSYSNVAVVRQENALTQYDRLKFRAEGLLGNIVDTLLRFVRRIIKFIGDVFDGLYYLAFGKRNQGGVQNKDKTEKFLKVRGVDGNTLYTIPHNHPLQNIFVREGSNSKTVKTSLEIMKGIELSIERFMKMFDKKAIEETFELAQSFYDNKITEDELKSKLQKIEERYMSFPEVKGSSNDPAVAGLDVSDIDFAFYPVRLSARELYAIPTNEEHASPRLVVADTNRFSREAFAVPRSSLVTVIKHIEDTVKMIDQAVALVEKTVKPLLLSTEKTLSSSVKVTMSPEDVKELRKSIMIGQSVSTCVAAYVKTYSDLRDYSWFDKISQVQA